MKDKATKKSQNPARSTKLFPKLCGADIELGNFVLGVQSNRGTGFEASRLLLREIDGLPRANTFRGEACNCAACTKEREALESAGSLKNKNGGSKGNGSRQVTVNPQDWAASICPRTAAALTS